MSQKSITDLNINSITLSNSNYAGTEGYTAQANTLTTNNAGVLLVNDVPISSGGGGAVDAIEAGVGILVTEDPSGTFTIDNEGVLEVTAGDGISILETPSGSGIFEITNTVNPADFLTTTAAAATYQPIGAYLTASSLDPYSTTAEADVLYQPAGAYLTASSLDPYSTTAEANGLYQPLGVVPAPTITTFNIGATTALTPVGTTINIITQADNVIPLAGTYILNPYCVLQSYNAEGGLNNYLGTVELNVTLITPGGAPGTTIQCVAQYFTSNFGVDQMAVQASTVIVADGTQYLLASVNCKYLIGDGTQYNVLRFTNTYPPSLTLTKIG